ncbi:MAG: BON domain-containing protein [Acidobacteriota bacterium]
MTRTLRFSTAVAAVLALTVAAACSDRTDRRASDAAAATGNAAEKTGDAAVSAGRDVAAAAKDAATSMGDAAAKGGRMADAAVETMDVKMALSTDSRVDASDINVDTDHATKTVTLKGHVKTREQKTLAESIAEKKAVGYRVVNDLVVRP